MTRWEIIETTDYQEWEASLTQKQQEAIDERTEKLREIGPALGRPDVDRIHRSKLHNLKELRVSSRGVIRILFIFDPNRQAVLLIGGFKSDENKWNKWYREFIPRAEQIYERYLETKEK